MRLLFLLILLAYSGNSLANIGPDIDVDNESLGIRSILLTRSISLGSADEQQFSGNDVAAIDMDNDGRLELVLAACETNFESDPITSTGWLFFFSQAQLASNQGLNEIPSLEIGTGCNAEHLRLATGDADGDALRDLWVGNPNGNDSRGSLTLLFSGEHWADRLQTGASISVNSLGLDRVFIEGIGDSEKFGWSLAAMNLENGYSFAVGALNGDYSGSVTLLPKFERGFWKNEYGSSEFGVRMKGGEGERFGYALNYLANSAWLAISSPGWEDEEGLKGRIQILEVSSDSVEMNLNSFNGAFGTSLLWASSSLSNEKRLYIGASDSSNVADGRGGVYIWTLMPNSSDGSVDSKEAPLITGYQNEQFLGDFLASIPSPNKNLDEDGWPEVLLGIRLANRSYGQFALAHSNAWPLASDGPEALNPLLTFNSENTLFLGQAFVAADFDGTPDTSDDWTMLSWQDDDVESTQRAGVLYILSEAGRLFDRDDDGFIELDGGVSYGDGSEASEGGDCRGFDPLSYPGALEHYCDDIDQDCDGSDFQDRDGDGAAGCEGLPVGLWDCDDDDPARHPLVSVTPGDDPEDLNCDGNAFASLSIDDESYPSRDPGSCGSFTTYPALLLLPLFRRRKSKVC